MSGRLFGGGDSLVSSQNTDFKYWEHSASASNFDFKPYYADEGRAHNDDFDGVHSSDYTFRRHKVGEIGVILVYFDPNMVQTIVFYTPHDDLSFDHIMTGKPAVCSDASTIRSALPCDDPVVMSSSYAESETVD